MTAAHRAPGGTSLPTLIHGGLIVLALGLGSSCSGGGGGKKPAPPVVPLGVATVLPGACAAGPGPLPNASCLLLEVTALTNPLTNVELRVADPALGTPLIGTVVLGGGGIGADFFTDGVGGEDLSLALLGAGFRVIDRRWPTGWFDAGTGVREQSARYAVLLDWIRTNLHTVGPLCAVGNSGGSAEIAYTMTSWDGDDMLDLAVLGSGPPLTRLDYLCEVPASATWSAQCTSLVPPATMTCGQPTCEPAMGNPLCPLLPPAPLPGELLEDSILHSEAVVSYPTTDVRMLLGKDDCSSAVPLGLLYLNAIVSQNSVEFVPNTPHVIFSTLEGRDAIVLALQSSLDAPIAAPATSAPEVRVRITWIDLDGPR